MNAGIAAVGIMLILSLCRVHLVVALIVGALAGGLLGGLGEEGTLNAFNQGLGGGATVALSYALLGAFAVAIAKSGLAHALADRALVLDAVGNILNTVTGITTNLTGSTPAHEVLGQVTIPAGVAQVRVVLNGFSVTDPNTQGTIWFDDIWFR